MDAKSPTEKVRLSFQTPSRGPKTVVCTRGRGVTFFSIRCTLHTVSCRPVYAILNYGKRDLELIDLGKTKENSPEGVTLHYITLHYRNYMYLFVTF